jgi:DNA-directed RNA polymerase omega subunit
VVDPVVEAMIEAAPSKYALVIAVARRARELVDSGDPDARDRPVSRALWEMATGGAGIDDWSETYGYGGGEEAEGAQDEADAPPSADLGEGESHG